MGGCDACMRCARTIGLGLDRQHDEAYRAAGRRLTCPTRVLWASGDDLPNSYSDVLAVWRPWAENLRGGALDCSHHMAEEAPQALTDHLRALFAM